MKTLRKRYETCAFQGVLHSATSRASCVTMEQQNRETCCKKNCLVYRAFRQDFVWGGISLQTYWTRETLLIPAVCRTYCMSHVNLERNDQAYHESPVAQWLLRPTGAQKFMGFNPVGDSHLGIFFCPMLMTS